MRSKLKRALFHLSRCLGLFVISRWLTSRGVRILCFHGLSVADESCFRPGLFHRTETLRQRLETLKRRRYPVIPLEEAVEGLPTGDLPRCATVITFDDGFYSLYRDGIPLLHEYAFPATVYVTTYYLVNESPIFRLVVQFLFWKTKALTLDRDALDGPWTGQLDLRNEGTSSHQMWRMIDHAESHWTEAERIRFSHSLARELGVGYDGIVQTRMLSLVNAGEVRSMHAQGIDVQLHTHRHRLPVNATLAQEEIQTNRSVLEPLVERRCDHFCYPSGVWCPEHWPFLQATGVRSAATCDVGLNFRGAPVYALSRILETGCMTAIEFEAELCGYASMLRAIRRFLGKALPKGAWSRGQLKKKRGVAECEPTAS